MLLYSHQFRLAAVLLILTISTFASAPSIVLATEGDASAQLATSPSPTVRVDGTAWLYQKGFVYRASGAAIKLVNCSTGKTHATATANGSGYFITGGALPVGTYAVVATYKGMTGKSEYFLNVTSKSGPSPTTTINCNIYAK